MTDPWRYRCPEGHCDWVSRVRGGFYCRTCSSRYPKIVDMKTGESVRQIAN